MIMMIMKKIFINIRLLFLACLLMSASSFLKAQNTMRIHYGDGRVQDIPVEQIDSVTFVDITHPEDAPTLIGSWLWGNRQAGYYEVLTFNTDHTYTGIDNYFSMGFETQTYGWYTQYGSMLTLQSNGYGYKRRYNWFLTGLTDNALEVMTTTGPFVYYKLQSTALTVSSGSTLTLSEGDEVVFTDGLVADGEGNSIIPLSPGTTYVLIKKSDTPKILAFKLTVN